MTSRSHRGAAHSPSSSSTAANAATPGRATLAQNFDVSSHMEVASAEPAAALPTGIEGTPQQQQADAFLRIVRAELVLWRAFLRNWRGELPGRPAFEAALAFERGMGGHLDPSTGQDAGDSDGPLRQYLRRQLGAGDLQQLEQMVSFNEGGGSRGALAEIFGVPRVHVVHSYRLVMQVMQVRSGVSQGQGHLEAGATAGIARRRFEIEYSNNLHMRYRHQMTGVNVSGGVAFGVSASMQPPGTHEPGGPNVSGGGEAELTSSDSETVNPGYFWAPDWFDSNYLVANVQAGAEGGVGAGPGGGGGSATLASVTRVTFIHGGNSIDFHFSDRPSLHPSPSVGSSFSRHDQAPHVALNAQAEVGAGHAFGDETHGTAPPPPPPPGRRVVKTGQMYQLVTGWIDFDTQRAEINANGDATLVAVVRAVRDYAARYPDSDFQTTLTADASPRWEGARTDAEANQLNEQLSVQRATTAQERLRAAVEQVIGPIPNHGDYRSLVAVQTRGSQQARHDGVAMTEDPQRYRRVYVMVEASLYREGEP